MSCRRDHTVDDAPTTSPFAHQLRREIEALKTASATAPASPEAVSTTADASQGTSASQLVFEDLSPTEQACASLGAQPDALKPISWLNNAHYDQLVAANALDPDLARRLEAYKIVAQRG